MTTNCGWCGTPRTTGDICCEQQARNQGRLHATCNHPPPEGTAAELVAIYEKATEEGLEPSGPIPRKSAAEAAAFEPFFHVVVKEVHRSGGKTGKKWALPPMPWEDAVRLETAVRNALPGLNLNRAYSVGTELWEDSNDPH